MELLYADSALLVCVKPAGVLSTDEPGGVPELAREALGDRQADVAHGAPPGPCGGRADGPRPDGAGRIHAQRADPRGRL